MPAAKHPPSELIAVAELFDKELEDFGKLTEAVRKLPLRSQKDLQRAADIYQKIAASELRLGSSAQSLVAAIGAARERQLKQAESIQVRAEEIRHRTEVATALLQRYAALGEAAVQVNAMANQVLQLRHQLETAEDPQLSSALLALLERLSEIVGVAHALTEDARQAGFDDIARQVDDLRQQLRSARDKIASISSVDRSIPRA